MPFNLLVGSFSGLWSKGHPKFCCRFACGILFQDLLLILVKLEKRCLTVIGFSFFHGSPFVVPQVQIDIDLTSKYKFVDVLSN